MSPASLPAGLGKAEIEYKGLSARGTERHLNSRTWGDSRTGLGALPVFLHLQVQAVLSTATTQHTQLLLALPASFLSQTASDGKFLVEISASRQQASPRRAGREVNMARAVKLSAGQKEAGQSNAKS